MHRANGPYVGILPPGLLKRVWKHIPYSSNVLHVCAGTIKEGICIDLNSEFNPTIVADAHHLPFMDNTFDNVVMDPPYNDDYVQHYSDIAQTQARTYPDFILGRALKECSRVCRIGGNIILFHWLIAIRPPYTTRVLMAAVTMGPSKRIRCLQVFKKVQQTLLES